MSNEWIFNGFTAPDDATHAGVRDRDGIKDVCWYRFPSSSPRSQYDFLYEKDRPGTLWDDNVGTPQHIPLIERPVTSTAAPTLETMLTEWRDLTARAQAAQAEADTLFEHAGQCHGEICVRLAKLGWGAPRVATVVSEPVLDEPDMDDYNNWLPGDKLVIIANEASHEFKIGDEVTVRSLSVGDYWFLGPKDAKWVSRPSAQQ